MEKRSILTVLVALLTSPLLPAQPTDTSAAVVNVVLDDNEARFSSALRPLRQVAGAPEAFYSYFWEFGDGSFSFLENPVHRYKDTGLYNVRLYATNNYDDGKPPPTRPKPLRVSGAKHVYASAGGSGFFKDGGSLEMKVNRMPRPGEEMVLILGYRNEDKTVARSGSLILFYNEKQFRRNNFRPGEERLYNNETRSSLNDILAMSRPGEISERVEITSGPSYSEPPLPGTRFAELINSKLKVFSDNNSWKFSNLQPGQEKFIFISLNTTPEMIRDTNAVVILTGMYLPDDPGADLEEFSLELQIVASHDPNKMMLRNQRLNYRFTGKQKEMTYKVRFQNTGRGPSRLIRVGVHVPSMLDARSLEILDYRPRAILCDSAYSGQSCLDTIIGTDSIWFVFKNIYLPGVRQEQVSDMDSTMGFIRYRLQFNKELKKLPFESGARIYFDSNEPISTNGTRGYFMPGNSPSVIAGYSKLIGENAKFNKDENYFLIGAGWSPYSPYKKYYQAEAYLGTRSLPEQLVESVQNIDTMINNQQWLLVNRNTYRKSRIILLELVPLQLRYNIMDYLGVGAGTQIRIDAITINKFRKEMDLQPQFPGSPMTITATDKTTNWFTKWDASIFGDVQVGKVRAGPVIGIRFLHYFRVVHNRIFVYVAWRL